MWWAIIGEKRGKKSKKIQKSAYNRDGKVRIMKRRGRGRGRHPGNCEREVCVKKANL